MDNNQSFHESLEELIRLFKQLKEHSKEIEDKDFDISFIDDFDNILSNYGMLTENISPEIVEQVGSPLKEMIQVMVEQLRDELAEIEKNHPKDDLKNVTDDLNKITEMLRNADPNSPNIDELLDKRSELLKQQDDLKKNE